MTPWEQLLANLAKLISVEAILSFLVVSLFVWRLVNGEEMGAESYGLMMMVLTYWFCRLTKSKGE